jgi:hypothetical protein
MNKKIRVNTLLAFLLGVVLTSGLFMGTGAHATRNTPEAQPLAQEWYDNSFDRLMNLQMQNQMNTLDEWNIFAKFRAVQGLRLAVFYARSAMTFHTDDFEYLNAIVELAYEIALDASLQTNVNTQTNIILALDLLDKGVLMYVEGVPEFQGYTPIDYMSGAEAYLIQEIYNTPINFYLVTPEYVQFKVNYNEHPQLYPLLRDNVLQQFQNILMQKLSDFRRAHSYEDQLEFMMNNLAYTMKLALEFYNWSNGFYPPQSHWEEWNYIAELMGFAWATISEITGTHTWLTRTEYAQAAWFFEQNLVSIQMEIAERWGVYPDNAPIIFPDGVFYIDDFGVVREGQITDPFYFLNDRGEFERINEEAFNRGVQLYRQLADGTFQRIEEDGLELAIPGPGTVRPGE